VHHPFPASITLVCDWFVKYTAGLAGGIAEATGAPTTLLTRGHDHEFGGAPGAMRAYVQRATEGRVRHLELPGRVRDPRGVAGMMGARRLVRGAAPGIVHFQDTVGNDPRLLLAAGVVDAPAVAPLPAAPTLLFFGRISTYYKGLDVLLDALPRVWERVPGTRLVIAGAGELPAHPVLADPRVDVRNAHVPDAAVPGLFRGDDDLRPPLPPGEPERRRLAGEGLRPGDRRLRRRRAARARRARVRAARGARGPGGAGRRAARGADHARARRIDGPGVRGPGGRRGVAPRGRADARRLRRAPLLRGGGRRAAPAAPAQPSTAR
jgi:hypothetical protein